MVESQNSAISSTQANSQENLVSLSIAGRVGVAVLLVALLLAVNSTCLVSPPLMDEQYLLAWVKAAPKLHGAFGLSGFMAWPGFEAADTLGFSIKLLLFVFAFVFGKTLFLYKFMMLVAKAASAYLVYLITRKIVPERLTAISAGFIFAFFPLHYETQSWLGGIACEMGTLAFLGAFHLFLLGRHRQKHWIRLAVIGLLMLISVSCSAILWPCCLAFALYELCDFAMPSTSTESRDLSMSLISLLVPILPVALYLAASGAIGAVLLPDFRPDHILSCFRHLFMPINEINWHKYSKEYVVAYVLYGFAVPALLAGLTFSSALRKLTVFAFLFLAVTAIPLVGIAAVDSTLYGERWLYAATIPVCMILAAAVSGLAALPGKAKIVGRIIGAVLSIAFCVFFFRHLWNENAANCNYARVLRAMQKSMKILHSKENMPMLIARDLPEKISIAPAYSPRGPVVVDPDTGLLRSNPVPDGEFKALLREKKILNQSWRWEKDMKMFIPLDIFTDTAVMPESLNAEQIGSRMEPPPDFYKTVHYSSDKTELILESNSENGPVITLSPHELSTVDGDYLFIEAVIDAPAQFTSPRIELHWQTRVHQNYEKRERFTYADAVVNDNQSHRYLLSLRGNGWTSGGMPTVLALGFPAGSKVRLQKMGLIKNAGTQIAQLRDGTSQLADISKSRFTPPYFNYPLSPEFGLYPLASNAESFACDYNVEAIEGASGVTAEISYPNRNFDDANSNHLSGQTYKVITQSGKSGRIVVNTADLLGPGVCSIRVIARSGNGNYLGQFSDPLCYQVPRVKREH